MSERPFVIGLTGPIGCGKSTVARMLGDAGAVVIDADALAREVTAPGQPTLPAIRVRFGDGVFAPDGSLDRSALAAVVFEDAAALAELEGIVHPAVRRRVEAVMETAAVDAAPLVALEAIKLVEGGLADRCDEVWIVECAESDQRARLAARGAAVDDVDRRIGAQGPDLASRLAARLGGRVVRRIDTSGDLAATRDRVEDALADALAPMLLDG